MDAVVVLGCLVLGLLLRAAWTRWRTGQHRAAKSVGRFFEPGTDEFYRAVGVDVAGDVVRDSKGAALEWATPLGLPESLLFPGFMKVFIGITFMASRKGMGETLAIRPLMVGFGRGLHIECGENADVSALLDSARSFAERGETLLSDSPSASAAGVRFGRLVLQTACYGSAEDPRANVEAALGVAFLGHLTAMTGFFENVAHLRR